MDMNKNNKMIFGRIMRILLIVGICISLVPISFITFREIGALIEWSGGWSDKYCPGFNSYSGSYTGPVIPTLN